VDKFSTVSHISGLTRNYESPCTKKDKKRAERYANLSGFLDYYRRVHSEFTT